MANFTISPNMNLIIPGVGLEPGPQFATDVNNSLTLIDQHDHTPGNGVQVTPQGLNISSDLTFNDNNLTNARSLRLQPQGAPLSDVADVGALYEAGVDLYYNDGNGNQIRITQSGAVAGTPGSIANLLPPASATYVSSDSTFVWQSNTNTPANMDAASYIFRNLVANSKGLTLSPPNAMATNYTLVLPSLPASTKFMRLDASGNMSADVVQDGTSLVISSGTLQVNVDDVTIENTGSVSVKNGYITYEFKLNGPYSTLITPATAIDGLCFFNFNAEIVNIWAYNLTTGTSGTTELDLKVATAPAGSFTSIFTTTPKFTSIAFNNMYVDANGVVPPGTGVTAPVLTSTSLNAGSAIRMDLIQAMAGGADCGIVIQFKQRN